MEQLQLLNDDWLRVNRFGLRNTDGTVVSTVDQLVEVIGGKERLAHFMTLPAAMPMPEALRAEVEKAIGKGTSQ